MSSLIRQDHSSGKGADCLPVWLSAALSAVLPQRAELPVFQSCRLQSAIATASEAASTQAVTKLLKPLMTAVEMVFGSAAALSATFGSKALPSV